MLMKWMLMIDEVILLQKLAKALDLLFAQAGAANLKLSGDADTVGAKGSKYKCLDNKHSQPHRYAAAKADPATLTALYPDPSVSFARLLESKP